VLEFAALDFDWIALYADVIKLTGAATVRRTDSINIDGAPGADGSDAPPTPAGYGTNGLNGKAGGPGREGGFQRVPTVYIFCQQVLLNGIQARPSDVGGPRPTYPFAFQFDGYDGGKGGDGGNGGDGGDGNQGSPARSGWIVCTSVPGWVDAEVMVVEAALLGKGVMGLMEALFMLLCNRARRQSLMYCHIQTKRVERA
jgi:hypothetical protein